MSIASAWFKCSVLGMLLLFAQQRDAHAASVYSFGTSGYSVPLGETVEVPVYLDIDGPELTTLLNDGGLYSAAVRFSRMGLAPSQPAFLADASAIVSNPEFSLSVIDGFSSSSAGLLAAIAPASSGVTGEGDAVRRRILIGTFNLSPGGIVGQTTFYTASDFAFYATGPSADNAVTLLGNSLDPVISATVFITVAPPVPIPAAAPAVAVFLLAWAGATRFRAAIRQRE